VQPILNKRVEKNSVNEGRTETKNTRSKRNYSTSAHMHMDRPNLRSNNHPGPSEYFPIVKNSSRSVLCHALNRSEPGSKNTETIYPQISRWKINHSNGSCMHARAPKMVFCAEGKISQREQHRTQSPRPRTRRRFTTTTGRHGNLTSQTRTHARTQRSNPRTHIIGRGVEAVPFNALATAGWIGNAGSPSARCGTLA
jgi:hypothetical protein